MFIASMITQNKTPSKYVYYSLYLYSFQVCRKAANNSKESKGNNIYEQGVMSKPKD